MKELRQRRAGGERKGRCCLAKALWLKKAIACTPPTHLFQLGKDLWGMLKGEASPLDTCKTNDQSKVSLPQVGEVHAKDQAPGMSRGCLTSLGPCGDSPTQLSAISLLTWGLRAGSSPALSLSAPCTPAAA